MKNNYLDKGKITILSLFMFCLGIVSPTNSFGSSSGVDSSLKTEQIQEKKVTIIMKDVALDNILIELCRQADLEYVFSSTIEIDPNEKYSISVSNIPASSALKYVIAQTPYTFAIEGRKIVISEKKVSARAQQEQRVTISGKVIDSNALPLVGVMIVFGNSSEGTISDKDGNFIINTTVKQISDNKELVFSYVGMEDKIVVVAEKEVAELKDIIVAMETDAMLVNDVIVTGYGNLSKNSFTGSVKSLTNAEIKKISPNNVFVAIQAIDPSFRIMENNEMGSNPNNVPNITIRGTSGITGTEGSDLISRSELTNNPNLPTFILNGFEVSINKIFDLDINRIESITILKDAAATAMYGSRAATGVVVVNTLAPKAGELQVSYNVNLKYQTPDLSDYNLASATEKLEIERMAGIYDFEHNAKEGSSWTPSYDKVYSDKLRSLESGINTDWMALPLRNALSHNHYLRLEGGANNILYGIDFNFDSDNGVMKESFRRNYGISFDLQYSSKKFLFKNTISFNVIPSNESPYGNFADFARMNPYNTYLDEYGNVLPTIVETFPTTSLGSTNGSSTPNPMYDAGLGSFNKATENQFIENFSVKYMFNTDFHIEAKLAYSYSVNRAETFTDAEAGQFINYSYKGSATNRTAFNTSIEGSLMARYNKNINNHFINFGFGGNIKESTYDSVYESYRGFPTGGFFSPAFAEEMVNDKPQHYSETSRLIGALTYLNYTYNNIYLLDLSARIDGSSVFGTEQKYAPFWSSGVGINIHNYEFMSNDNLFSRLKVSATYGITGKANFAASTARTAYGIVGNSYYATGSGAQLISLGNENLKWERTEKFNLLLDVEMFNGILQFQAEKYHNTTHDQVAQVYIPSSAGFTSYYDNVGIVTNQGYDASVRIRAYRNDELSIYLFGNMNHNTNVIDEISNSMRSHNENIEAMYATGATSNAVPVLKYYEGASLTSIYGMNSLGIDPMTGKEYFRYADGTTGYDWIASENVVIGNTEPNFTGTFGFNIYYKGFNVDAYFSYDLGAELYNQTLQSKIENANLFYNVDKRILTDRWVNPGDDKQYKDIALWDVNTLPTSRFIQMNNVLKLTSLSVGYELPSTMLKKLNLSRVKINFTTNDLGYYSTILRERGTSYPFARDYNLSLNINF